MNEQNEIVFPEVSQFFNDLIVSSVRKYAAQFELPWELAILLAAAILLLSLFFIFANLIKKNEQLFGRISNSEMLVELIRSSVSIVIKLVGVIIALQILGLGTITTAAIGSIGIFSLGISFAFKDIIENYIAGIILSARQPFLKGEHVLIDGHEGLVQKMTSRMTMLKDFNGNNISIPNAKIFKNAIINFSRIPERRFQFSIGISPEADPNNARVIGINEIKMTNGVLAEPKPIAVIDAIGDSSINLIFYAWVDQNRFDFNQVRSMCIARTKDAIERNGIEVPDPSYVIKLMNMEKADTKELAKPKLNQKDLDVSNQQKNVILNQIINEEKRLDHTNVE